MRSFRGLYCGLLLLAVGGPGEALAACCVSTPVHVYVPPPRVVVVPHTTYVPRTTYVPPTTSVRPAVGSVNPQTSTNTTRTNLTSTHSPTVRPKHTPPVQTVTVVNTQPATTKKRCAEKGQGGDGCKKKEEQTTWSRIKQWLRSDNP
jgi:hypothetical protein